MPVPTPYINIVDGSVTGTLTKNGIFYWYNPTSDDVPIAIENVGTWCASSAYTIPQGSQQYVQAQFQNSPNENSLAWVSDPPSAWTGGGTGPHVVSEGNAPGTPSLSLQTGACSGKLQNGGKVQLVNPTIQQIKISSCGGWCAASGYTIPNSSAPTVDLATVMNKNGCVWTENPNRFNGSGMPHIGTPPWPSPKNEENEEKEVA